jgi:hypothetical protein
MSETTSISELAETPKGRRLWGWLPVEVLWLLGFGVFFYLLGRVHWAEKWEGFQYNPVIRRYLPATFLIAAGYVMLGTLRPFKILTLPKFRLTFLMEVLLGLLAVLYIKYLDPMLYVDDTGFILRYLDHFKEGCFYCYNPEDGPVFGISSFVYGLLAGAIRWTGILNSEGTIHYLTYLGTFTTAILFFRILRKLFKSDVLVIVFWLLIFTCNRSMLLIYNSGMEAPIHVSIVLAAVYFFLSRNDRMMWLFLAISVISKLDAVPLVLVVSLFWFLENRKALLPIAWDNRKYRHAILFGLLPVLLWIAFAEIVFGGPLPQSAYAKVFFHGHSGGSWFPFLDGLTFSNYRAPFFYTTFILFIAQVGYAAAKREGGRNLVLGFAFFATMLLYYLYNPAERMLWYYVLPEGLMMFQLCVSLHWFWGFLKGNGRLAGILLTVGTTFLFTWTQLFGEHKYFRSYEHVVEGERLIVGDYLAERVEEKQTILSGHGLLPRKVKGYVIDETGLNSKIVTNLKCDSKVVWDSLKPDWIVMHGYHWEVDDLNNFPYKLDTSFYDVATYSYPTWRVFKRTPTMEESAGNYFLHLDAVSGDSLEQFEEPQQFLRVHAMNYTIARADYNPREWKITFALFKHEFPFSMTVRDVLAGDSVVWEQTYQVPGYVEGVTSRTFPITIPLLRQNIPTNRPIGPRKILLTFENSYGRVMMYDPMISILRKDP